MRDSPYRQATARVERCAETEKGSAKLEVAPDHLSLALGERRWIVARRNLTILSPGRRKPKKRSVVLGDARLFLARGWPTNEVALWWEPKPGQVERLFGLTPRAGMSEEIMESWRDLDRLAAAFKEGLRDQTSEGDAFELGAGGHRVFGVRSPARMSLFARPVFRERPRKVIEVQDDGSITSYRGRRPKSVRIDNGAEVIASGDRIKFCRRDGEELASVFLPWIGRADREELRSRFQRVLGEPRRAPSLGVFTPPAPEGG